MTPHSSSADVEATIHEINTGHRMFLGIQDARAIASWYISPREYPALQTFAQGGNIAILPLKREVQSLCEDYVGHESDPRSELLHLLAYIAMRGGMSSFIDGRE